MANGNGNENENENPSVEPYRVTEMKEEQGSDSVLDGECVQRRADLQVIIVGKTSEWIQALSEAVPGQIIEMTDGCYDADAVIEILQKKGTMERPIIVRARNQGKAIISGKTWIKIVDSSYVVIEGLRFETETMAGGPRRAIELQNSGYNRVTRNEFALRQSPHVNDNGHVTWIVVKGEDANYNRIDRNHFVHKLQFGMYITIEGIAAKGSPGTGYVPQHTRIDRNHFQDVIRTNANGAETLKIGAGSQSVLTNAYTVIEYNLFERCSGEDEIISVKSSGNTIRYNTFLESEGAVVLRYGNGCQVYGNFFLGNYKPRTAGVRIHGMDHKVYNNYFEGLANPAINIGWGSVDEDPTVANVYWQVKRTEVIFNTFINDGTAIASVAPGNNRVFAPMDTVVANNIVTGEEGKFVNEVTAGQPSGISWSGNVMFSQGTAVLGIEKSPEEIRVIDPRMASNGMFQQISAGSPAIDAAVGRWTYVQEDIVGLQRKLTPDVGATEFQALPGNRRPLTPEMVGP